MTPMKCFLAWILLATTTLAAPFHPAKLREIDEAVASAIADKKTPGGVLWIEHDGHVCKKAYGNRTLLPAPQPASRTQTPASPPRFHPVLA